MTKLSELGLLGFVGCDSDEVFRITRSLSPPWRGEAGIKNKRKIVKGWVGVAKEKLNKEPAAQVSDTTMPVKEQRLTS
jgi:hypothetical protein